MQKWLGGFTQPLFFYPKWIGNKLFINQFERAFWLNFLHILRNHVVTKNHACGTINMFLQLWRIGSRCKNSHNNSCSEWVGFGLVARFTTFTCVGTDSSTNTVHRSDTFAWYCLQELVLKVLVDRNNRLAVDLATCTGSILLLTTR